MTTCPYCRAPQEEETANCLYCGVRLPSTVPAARSAGGPSGETDLGRLRARWEQIKILAAHCAVGTEMSFSRTMRYWTSGVLLTRSWSHHLEGDVTSPSSAPGEVSVLVEGNVRAPVELPGEALLHVLGDVGSTVRVGDYSEIVVAGDVVEGGLVEVTGMAHVFVGGSVQGAVKVHSSGHVYVMGSVTGTIGTGAPRAVVRVAGDFLGSAEPAAGDAALFDLEVAGYLPQAVVKATTGHGYTAFNASAGRSDLPPGVYPNGSDNFWVVRREARRG